MTTKYADTKLINADCMVAMQGIQRESIDLIFTSPPYNLGNPIKGNMFKSKAGERIEYNAHDDDLPYEEYVAWQREVLKICYSLIKEDGAIFYNHKPRIKNLVWDDRKNLIPFDIRQEIVWDTSCLFNYNGSFFVPHTERIFIIAKPKWKPNRQYVSMGEVWSFRPDRGIDHPATFPLELARKVVLSASSIGETVLDPFMGSGTVGVACAQTDRNFIGIEIDSKYYGVAKKRINEVKQQPRLL